MPQNHTPSLQYVGENAMLMYMYVYNLRTQITVLFDLEHEVLARPYAGGKQVPGSLWQYVNIFVLVERPSACTHAF